MAQKSSTLISKLSAHLFWDLDKNKLDPEKNKTYIIERVFTRGNLSDLQEIIHYYGYNVLKEEIVKAGALDKKTLNWAAFYFNLKKTDFRCYSKIQSNQIHWNF